MRTAAAFILLAFIVAAGTPADAAVLSKNTHWSGRVEVEGQLIVEKKAVLTIEPGTVVVFKPGKLDEEGLSDCGMIVKGTIVAKGEPGKRITFTSGARSPVLGDWGEIKLFTSEGSAFSNCDFTYGGWGLHLHDSDLKVSDCTFTKNSYGGIRMKGGSVEITGCTIRGMEIGIRYWLASPSIHHNSIVKNRTGIFCRQGGGGSAISMNDIVGNSEYDFKLGDGQTEDMDASHNWWGTTDVAVIRKKIYDKDREDYIGRVVIEPVLTKPVIGK